MKRHALSSRICLAFAILAASVACDVNHPDATRVLEAATPVPIVLDGRVEDETALSLAVRGKEFRLTRSELESIRPHRVQTSTFWSADHGTFEGPLLRDVLARVGLDSAEAVRLTGLDGFSNVIPRQDWERWPILIASRNDGKPIPISAKGPLRIIYPRDMDAELLEPIYRLRWVWLLARIEEAP